MVSDNNKKKALRIHKMLFQTKTIRELFFHYSPKLYFGFKILFWYVNNRIPLPLSTAHSVLPTYECTPTSKCQAISTVPTIHVNKLT